MKRDLELARRLLLEIEARGTDCSVSVLRSGPEHETEERVRYHLRLLTDAGLLKEIDRTSAGIPCIRLTNDGHELLELARVEQRWREAVRVCQQRTGGTSLTVIRGILQRWAFAAPAALPRRRYATPRYLYETDYYRDGLLRRVDPYSGLERYIEDAGPAEVRQRTARGPVETAEWAAPTERFGVDLNGDGVADIEYDPVLPTYIY